MPLQQARERLNRFAQIIQDLLVLVRNTYILPAPSITYEPEDGVLTLQWQDLRNTDHGVAILLSGDGQASYCRKTAEHGYAVSGDDVSVYEQAPKWYMAMVFDNDSFPGSSEVDAPAC